MAFCARGRLYARFERSSRRPAPRRWRRAAMPRFRATLTRKGARVAPHELIPLRNGTVIPAGVFKALSEAYVELMVRRGILSAEGTVNRRPCWTRRPSRGPSTPLAPRPRQRRDRAASGSRRCRPRRFRRPPRGGRTCPRRRSGPWRAASRPPSATRAGCRWTWTRARRRRGPGASATSRRSSTSASRFRASAASSSCARRWTWPWPRTRAPRDPRSSRSARSPRSPRTRTRCAIRPRGGRGTGSAACGSSPTGCRSTCRWRSSESPGCRVAARRARRSATGG
jgi:hypothetical protein